MPTVSNTYSVVVSDGTHNATMSGIAGSTHLDAALTALEELQNQPQVYGNLSEAETWTITVTQP